MNNGVSRSEAKLGPTKYVIDFKEGAQSVTDSYRQLTFFKSLYMKAELCNLTRLEDGDKKIKFMLKILEKMHAGFETICKVGFGSEKIISYSQHCRK